MYNKYDLQYIIQYTIEEQMKKNWDLVKELRDMKIKEEKKKLKENPTIWYQNWVYGIDEK